MKMQGMKKRGIKIQGMKNRGWNSGDEVSWSLIEEYFQNQEEFDATFHAVIGSLKSQDLALGWILYDNDNENAHSKVSTLCLWHSKSSYIFL